MLKKSSCILLIFLLIFNSFYLFFSNINKFTVRAEDSGLLIMNNITSGQPAVNGTITVNVQVFNNSSSLSISSVGLKIGFDKAKLQYQSFVVESGYLYDSAEVSDDNTQAKNNADPNSTGILLFSGSSASVKTISSYKTIIKITFKGIASGTASLSFNFTDPYKTTVLGSTSQELLTDPSQSSGTDIIINDGTPTATQTQTATSTQTATATQTGTQTATDTPTDTNTQTDTQTNTQTSTNTQTQIGTTNTQTSTSTYTNTSTATRNPNLPKTGILDSTLIKFCFSGAFMFLGYMVIPRGFERKLMSKVYD